MPAEYGFEKKLEIGFRKNSLLIYDYGLGI